MPDLVQFRKREGVPSREVRTDETAATKCDLTIVAHSGDMDKLMAAFIIATGAAASGRRVSMFFSFWGLNALRTSSTSRGKSILERLAGWMMPRNPAKLPSSRMNMFGMGPRFFRRLMRRKRVQELPALIDLAEELDVRLIACRMSMDLLGLREEELREGIHFGGVATYLLDAEHAGHNLFI